MVATVFLLLCGVNNTSYLHSNIPVLKLAPSSLSELQRGLQDARQWHGSYNDLLIGKDSVCPVNISMTPACRSIAASPPRALLMQLHVRGLYTEGALLSFHICLYILILPCSSLASLVKPQSSLIILGESFKIQNYIDGVILLYDSGTNRILSTLYYYLNVGRVEENKTKGNKGYIVYMSFIFIDIYLYVFLDLT